MVQLSHDEAQTLIYRGCARLAKAMQVKHLAKDAAPKWEDEVLREARAVLAALMKAPLTEDLVLPPLPLALLEAQKRLHNRRPLKPSDIHSPFEQASTSPWSLYMTHEDDPQIPSQIDLGDPSTFWWKDLEERTMNKVTPAHVPLKHEDKEVYIELTRRPWPGAKRSRTDVDELDSDQPPTTIESGPSTRSRNGYRTNSSTEDQDEDQLLSAKTSASMWVELTRRMRSGAKRSQTEVDELESDQSPTTSESGPSSRSRKRYCADPSAEDEIEYQYIYLPKCDRCKDEGLVCYVPGQGQRACTPCRLKKCRCSAYRGKNRAVRRSNPSLDRKSGSKKEPISDWLRPQGVEPTCTLFESQHEPTSKISVRPVEPPKIGPPGGRWMWQKRAERASPAGCSPSTIPRASMAASASVATPAVLAPGSVPTAAIPKRTLVDKSVETESQPLGKLGPQEAEFIKGLVSLIFEVMRHKL